MRKIIKLLVLAVLPIYFVTAQASYMPRVYLAGAAGTNVLGKADILAPIYTNPTNNLFAYAQGKYAYEEQTWEDNTWTGSFGLGYRHILNNTFMLGVYGLADYTTATSGYRFWVLSPGIEGYTPNWEFRANGYFPQNKKRWVDEGWASEFGDYQYIRFVQHQQWDERYQFYQETGNGADAEVGHQLYNYKNILFKGYINGFYNNMQDNDDLYGGGARITVEPTNYLKFSLAYSYDNYEHNAFMIGIQASIYDIFNPGKASQDLQQKLYRPIERNFATIDSGSAVCITRSDNQELLGEQLMHDNVWFFNPGAANDSVGGTGTYEDPLVGLNPDTMSYVAENFQSIGATIDKYPLLYLRQGTYTLNAFTAINSSYRINIPADWGMYGWEMLPNNYNHPAMGDIRPLIIGGFNLNSNTSINNLRMENSQAANLSDAVTMDNAINVYINNVMIGPNPAQSYSSVYRNNVVMENGGSLSVNDSQLNAMQNCITALAYKLGDIIIISGINNSTFNAGNNGIEAFYGGTGTITICDINDTTFIARGNGIDVGYLGTGTITIRGINNSTFNARGNGIYSHYVFGTGTISINDINNSTFDGGSGINVLHEGTGTIAINDINNSTFNTESNGIYTHHRGSGVITINNINNSTFNTGNNGISGVGNDNSKINLNILGNVFKTQFGSNIFLLGGANYTINGMNLPSSPELSGVQAAYNLLLEGGNSFTSYISGKHLNIDGKTV